METKQETIQSLITLSEIDTLFGDLYLERAKELLHDEMPFEAYRGLLRMEGELNSFPNRIENAMMQGKWQEVQELTGEMQSLKQSAESYAGTMRLAKRLYQQEEIAIDPFSPGMLAIAGKPGRDLRALRENALSLFASLKHSEPGWQRFYGDRQLDFALEVPAADLDASSSAAGKMTPERLQQEAVEALGKGNLNKLREVAEALAQAASPPAGQPPADSGTPAVPGPVQVTRRLDYSFPDAVLQRAATFGLAPFKVPSRFTEYTQLLAPFMWRPTFPDLESDQRRTLRLSALPLPPDTPQALRSRVEMFVLHPFINSAGVRFLPPLVEEDVLVENFPEPEPGGKMASSALLEALGLTRNSMTRMQIEAALAAHGYQVVKEKLGLDPAQFRLICIPPDLHLRIGMDCGWGGREIWTHFDGYMLTADGRMSALAGGDVRFGGIFDMVGIGRNYETDRIIVRFAVVQRRRMARLVQ